MTLNLNPQLSSTFALSGAIHLGLIALLLLEPRVQQHLVETVEVSFHNVTAPVAKRAPLADEGVVRAQSESVSNATISTVQTSEAGAHNGDHEYESYIRSLIQQRRSYPELAQRLRQQGKVMVRIKLERSGRVLEAELVSKSPHEILNRSAKKLIEEIGPLKPFPESVESLTMVLNVPIEYIL